MIAQLDREYLYARPTKVLSRLISYALFEGRPLTTRGRWINPLVFAQLGLARRLFAMRRVRAPIFLIGPGRSGTTILGKILSLHPDVGFLNEPKALWHAGVGDEDLIGSYSRGPARVRLSAEDATPEASRNMHRLLGAYLLATASRRVLDKYPELVFRVPFVRALFPDARFLFLVRDGHDTCASMVEWNRRHGVLVGGERHDWWGAGGRKWRLLVEQLVRGDDELGPHAEALLELEDPAARASVEWTLVVRAGLDAQEAHPEQVMRLTYEDLLATPSETLADVLHFCGLGRDGRIDDYSRRVLRPSSRGATVDRPPPHPLVAPLFARQMKRLGYGDGLPWESPPCDSAPSH